MSRAGGGRLIAGAVAASVALVIAYLAFGGGDYEPTRVADPCQPREWRSPDGVEESAQQFALSALDGAACELQVSRETLALALASAQSRTEFATEYGIEEAELEQAVRAGVVRGISDAEAAGALSPIVADGLRAIALRIPVDEAVALIDDASELFGDASDILGEALDRAGELLP